jgi:glycosyltransferase involved in cell wall biosynthesis
MPLKIAAKISDTDRTYFEDVVEPLLDESGIEFIGEIGGTDKSSFLGGAFATLFPIDWPEPFGLVMIESMACGTPVIAFPCGSVPEVIEDGVSGCIVRSIDQAVAALDRVRSMSRRACRDAFERRFSVERMARDYLEAYAMLGAPRI